jgi:thioredoxin reductase
MAAELKLVEPNLAVTLVHSRDKLLSSEPLPDEFKDRSALVLQEQGVKLILGHRVMKQAKVDLDDGTSHFKLTMSDGSEMLASHVIWAISKSIPSTTFLPEHTLNEEGYVKINGRYVHISI